MKKLDEKDFKDGADELRIEVAAIKAICEVEAPRGGFLPDGRPTILFERHQFSKRTNHRYDAKYPDISNTKRGGYLGGVAEWERLNRAATLAKREAIESASWGKFQIMGFNHADCGFEDIDDFVDAMNHSEGAQLKAFVALIKKWRLDDELRNHQWAAFAQAYNGAAYRDNQYDTKLANAYKKHKGEHLAQADDGNADAIQQTAANALASRPSQLAQDASDAPIVSEASQSISDGENVSQQAPTPTEASFSIKDGNIEMKTSEGTAPPEKIAIEKPAPANFLATMRNDIATLTGGNVTLQLVRDYAEQARALGLSPRFWTWISLIALVATVAYLLNKFFKHRQDAKRDLVITNGLITANTTPTNIVQLVDAANIPDYKEAGYKIVSR